MSPAAQAEKRPDPYPLEPAFERLVVLGMMSEPRFHSIVGWAVEADRLPTPPARLLAAATHAIAKKLGAGPTSTAVVIQHLATLSHRGKVSLDDLEAARDYAMEAELAVEGRLDIDAVVSELAPILRRVKQKEATLGALEDFKREGARPADTAQAFLDAEKIGVASRRWGATFDQISGASDFFDYSKLATMPTGVEAVDFELFGEPDPTDPTKTGGLEIGGLSVFVGESGAGKSIWLADVATEALLRGHDIVYWTGELSEKQISRRIYRNLVDMTQREMDSDPPEARRRMSLLRAVGVGRLFVGYSEPILTSPRDVLVRVREHQREVRGFMPKLWVFDYLEKMRTDPRSKKNSYEELGLVAEQMRAIAADHEGWCFTASQVTRAKSGKAWHDLDSIADSMNIGRVADLVIAIGRTEEDEENNEVRMSIPKRREGEGAHAHLGPFAHDFARGRIVIKSRRNPW